MINKYVIFIAISMILTSPFLCYGAKDGEVEYHDYLFDYSKYDVNELKQEADKYIEDAILASDKTEKHKIFHSALRNYYIILKILPEDIHSLNKTAYVYDMEDKNILARSFFAKSMNLDENNPETNFLVGDYFFKRRDFKRALRYFTKAYDNGYNEYEINYKLGIIYEKLGDLCNAKRFYEYAYKIDGSQSFLSDKINNMPEENPYYHGKDHQ